MSDYIPDDLLAKVLLRLPVDSLLRTRGVCKLWRALIDGSYFIQMHFETSLRKGIKSDDMKIVALTQGAFCALEFDPSEYTIANAKQLHCPLKMAPAESEIRFVGSCNGLICLTSSEQDIVFRNPWTQKHWELPPPPVETSMLSGAFFHLGFGYDRLNDDYKVVNIIKFSDTVDEYSRYYNFIGSLYVYSLKMNSRKIVDFPWKFLEYVRDDGTLANDAVHWVLEERERDDIRYSIFAFDLESEKLRLMDCPEDPHDSSQHNLRVLNGFLCLFSLYYSSWPAVIDFFRMENYGNSKSWTKLITIKMPDGVVSFWYLMPLVYLKNGREVLFQIEVQKFLACNLLTDSIEYVTIRGGLGSYLASCVCFPSLIRPWDVPRD